MTDTESNSFRVYEWDEYIGQEKLKERLQIHISSAKSRQAPRLDHIFVHGPPGCGKTTLAGVIANKFHVPFYKFIMPMAERTLKRVVNELRGVVLFDEIHRAPKKQQESLLTLIEDGYYQPASGNRIPNHVTTYIAATTERHKVIEPLYDRFNIKPEFEPYSDEEMGKIALGMLKSSGLDHDAEYAFRIGRAAGGVPRNVAQMVTMARDLRESGIDPTVDKVLHYCSTTHDGLTEAHVKYLMILHSNNNALGLQMLATHLQLAPASVLHLERLLFQRGWIDYAKASGRDLTTIGHQRVQEIKGQPREEQIWQ